VQRVESGGAAVHHVLERVDIATTEGTQTAWVVATNVFFKTALGWRLVLHHGSPGSMREARVMATEGPSTLH
jgi:ketosteroid isomerase-like protein